MTATKRKPKPITANPLFPFVTALWFATLLGLGSFATAPMLLEGPVVALGIPALIPAAAPPLGFTTRIIFAVAMMGIGAIVGYSLGRLFAREKVATPARARGFGQNASPARSSLARQPINAAQDLGAPLDSPVIEEPQARHRATIQNDELPAFESPAFITSPVEDPVVDSAEIGEQQIFKPTVTTSAAPHLADETDPLGLELLLDDANAIEPAPVATSQPMFAAPQQVLEQPTAPALFEPLDVEAEGRALSPDPFMPPAFAEVAADVAPEPAFIASAHVPQTSFLQARAVDATPIDRAPLDNLGLVQLVERLALAISRHATRSEPFEQVQVKASDFAAAAPVAEPLIARFEQSLSVPPQPELPSVEPETDCAFSTAVFAQSQQEQPEQPERVVQLRPSALQSLHPLADDEADLDAEGDEVEEQDAGLERFLRMSPLLARNSDQVAEAFGVTDSAAPEPEVVEDCYPSLLDMAPVVTRREPLRIDDSVIDDDAVIEPVVVFPGQETPRLAEAAWGAPTPNESSHAEPVQAGSAGPRLFERPAVVVPVPGSPLASPGRAAPSAQAFGTDIADVADVAASPTGMPDAEEADRALRAALATLQRMTARG